MSNIQAERDPDEEGDYMAFEQLMAEATAKREKKSDAKPEKDAAVDKEKKRHRWHGGGHGHDGAAEEKA
jgi:hypothetical protein